MFIPLITIFLTISFGFQNAICDLGIKPERNPEILPNLPQKGGIWNRAKNSLKGTVNYIGDTKGAHLLRATSRIVGEKVGRKENWQERAKKAFDKVAIFQDFIFYTINSVDGRPFMLKDYLEFHKNHRFASAVMEKIHSVAIANIGDKKEKYKELQNKLNEVSSMDHFSIQEQTEWQIKFLGWEEMLEMCPEWYEIFQQSSTVRENNPLVEKYRFMLKKSKNIKITRYDEEIPHEIRQELMLGEADLDQIEMELKISQKMIADENDIWNVEVLPDFEQYSKYGNAKNWDNLMEMHSVISHNLKLKVNKAMRELKVKQAEQEHRIQLKYKQKLAAERANKQAAELKYKQVKEEAEQLMEAGYYGLTFM